MSLTAAEKEVVKNKAKEAWAKANKNQKVGIRFGMTDMALLRASGYDPYTKDKHEQDEQHQFTLALMECATADGGMRA